MADALLDVAHSHAFAVGDDLRRLPPAEEDDLLFQALTAPHDTPDPEAAARALDSQTIEPPARPPGRSLPALPVSERPTPRDVRGSVAPKGVTRVAPVLANLPRSTGSLPSVADEPRRDTAERELRPDQHDSIDPQFDPAQLADELDARLQPRLQELALRLTRRIDDQFARAMFSAQAGQM